MMDGGDDAEDKSGVLPTTENDGAVRNENGDYGSISDEQWAALKDVVQALLDYREDE